MSSLRKKAPHGKGITCLLQSNDLTLFRCNERFIGYGGNKAACLFEMYLSGMSYHVLADHFIVHQNHLYEETARKNEVRFSFFRYP